MPEIPQSSIFTKILDRRVDGVILAISEACFSVLTHKAAQRGHSLIIPKREVSGLPDMKADELADFAIHTAFLSEGLKKLYKVPKVGLLYSGFEIDHFHLHAIPVFSGRNISIQNTYDVSIEERRAQGEKIQAALKSVGSSYKGVSFQIPENNF